MATASTVLCRAHTSHPGLNVSIVGLERALLQYTSDPSLADKPFDIKTVPVDTAPMKDLPKQSKAHHLQLSRTVCGWSICLLVCGISRVVPVQ